MVDERAFIDSWQSPFTKDPFEIPLESQLALLLAADGEMRRIQGVTLTETDMQFRKSDSWFASSIGSRIHQLKSFPAAAWWPPHFKAKQFKSVRIRIVLEANTRSPATSWLNRWSCSSMRR